MAIFKLNKFELYSNLLKNKIPVRSNNKKCILIGSNKSLLSGLYGDYINDANCSVIRINNEPDPTYYKNYGRKTTLFIGSPMSNISKLQYKYQNKIFITNLYLDICNGWNVTNYRSKSLKWATTGFLSICILATIFDEIELFGFGFTSDRHHKTFHYLNGNSYFSEIHDLGLEDSWINFWQKKYKGQIYRGEEIHDELRCDNTSKSRI